MPRDNIQTLIIVNKINGSAIATRENQNLLKVAKIRDFELKGPALPTQQGAGK
jgi:hypothetical protein